MQKGGRQKICALGEAGKKMSRMIDVESNLAPLVSVIVPVYNVEKYLGRCLDSVIDQTYRNLEIILINDGSTDRSGEICQHYAEKDPRIRVLTQKNQGLSAARNTGLDHMAGEYIVFVDSDDYVAPGMVEILLSQILVQGVPLAVCNYLKVADDDDNARFDIAPADVTCPSQRMGRNDVFDTIGTNHRTKFEVSWGKLYKKSIFENLRFELGKIYEDAFIFHKIYAQVDWICYVDLKLYAYRMSTCSITRKNGVSYFIIELQMRAWLDRLDFFQQYGIKRYVSETEKLIFSELAAYLSSGDVPKERIRGLIKETEEKVQQIVGKKPFLWRWALCKAAPKTYRFIRKYYLEVNDLIGGLKRRKI